MRLSTESKRGQHFIEMYNAGTAERLADFYGTYSAEKGRAERYILDEMQHYNENVFTQAMGRKAVGYRILSGNTFTFTAGYRIEKDGAPVAWVIHTAYNRYTIEKPIR